MTSETTRPDGIIEGRVRAWILANVTTSATITPRDVRNVTRRADRALGLGMTSGIAGAAIRAFVARVLTQRGQLPA
jgi:hypothetical protein